MTVAISEKITGLELADFSLTRNGVTVSLVGVPFRQFTSSYYEFDLTQVTNVAGNYVLTLSSSTSGIIDQASNALAGNVSINWVTDLTAPTVTMTQITVNPRNSAVGLITLDFSKPVTGLDLSDFALLRNGQTVGLSGLVLTTVSSTRYTLNLSTVTATPGAYNFSLNGAGAGIVDAAGNHFTTDVRREWTLERDYPFSAEFLAVCHVWRSPQGERRIAIKGAAETVMPLCGMDTASALRAQEFSRPSP